MDTRHLVLCSDDVHPNLLQREGHLDHRVRLAVTAGFDPVEVIQMATLNAAEHLRVDRDLGSVAPGKRADLVVLDDLASFSVSTVLHGGRIVAEAGQLVDEPAAFAYPDWSRDTIRLAAPVGADDLALHADGTCVGERDGDCSRGGLRRTEDDAHGRSSGWRRASSNPMRPPTSPASP